MGRGFVLCCVAERREGEEGEENEEGEEDEEGEERRGTSIHCQIRST